MKFAFFNLWPGRLHLSAESLSELLDGRLSSTRRSQVEAHLERCAECRQELASLQYTVELLQRVPTITPPRSFTLAAAPVPMEERREVRIPSWAFGAAAAAFTLVFAVVVSADLGGILAGEEVAPGPTAESAAETPEAPAEQGVAALPLEESVGQQETASDLARPAAPTIPPVPEALQQAAAPPQQEDIGDEVESAIAAADTLAPAETPSEELSTPVPKLAPPPAAEELAATPEAEEQGGTNVLWHVLEGAAGALPSPWSAWLSGGHAGRGVYALPDGTFSPTPASEEWVKRAQ